MLRSPLNSLPLKVLVDSGADDNFIVSDLCSQANLPTETLPEPRSVFGLNGQVLACVTHRTAPLSLQLSGNHHEVISLFVIPSSTCPIVLGLPWLKLHNPQIDWSCSCITNWSTFCHSHCLRSATPSSVPSPPVPSKPIDLSNVPAVYHDLQEVFSKEKALSLPPHRPYDCSIELLAGAPLPSRKLYNISKPEKEAMEQYITESLTAGLIRPSSSPVSAGGVFCF